MDEEKWTNLSIFQSTIPRFTDITIRRNWELINVDHSVKTNENS